MKRTINQYDFFLANPVTRLEYDMFNKYGIRGLWYAGRSWVDGCIKCQDEFGTVWHVKRKALEVIKDKRYKEV